MNRGRGGRAGRSGPMHPRGLKGREIGEFYKNRMREAKKKSVMGPNISLHPETIFEIERILNENKNEDNTNLCLEFERQFLSTLTTSFEEFLVKSKENFVGFNGDEYLDGVLKNELEKIKCSEKYKEILTKRSKLPVFEKHDDIIKSISENQVVLISGDTGCGKTTQVSQFILDYFVENGKGSLANIVCTQPRRISAITVAERVAWERTEKLGASVGYQIRLQGVAPRPQGSMLYCTTGILLRQMETDPLLSKISHIIIDEIHERSVETDILLGLLKKVMPHRIDLKVVLMSATFSIDTFLNYYKNCPVIYIHGTLFPVQCLYLEDVLQATKFKKFPPAQKKVKTWQRHTKRFKDKSEKQDFFDEFIAPYARNIQNKYSSSVIEGLQNPASEEINIDLIKELVFYIHFEKPEGAILVFLPGYDKISKLHTEITNSKLYQSKKIQVFPLHSMMPTVEQKTIFERPPSGVRKIILSTNIAETSVTIDDVVYVIDAGKIKQTSYDIEQNLQTLEEQWVTLSNSTQRRGRAGRVQPGICYHLYTRIRENFLDRFPTPEIVRCSLASIILNMKMLRIHDVATFFSTLIDAPHEQAITNSIKLLKRINALDDREQITPLGLHLARLPVDPQPGKMLLMASLFRCMDPITSVAASISFKDAFHRPIGKEKEVDRIRQKFAGKSRSDHLMLSSVIEDFRFAVDLKDERSFCYENFLSLSILNQLERMKGQFCEILEGARFLEDCNPQAEANNLNSYNHKVTRAVIFAGLYPNISHIESIKIKKNFVNPIIRMSTPEDRRVQFHPSSVNSTQRDFESRFFVYYLKQKSSAVYLFDTTMVHPMALLIFGDGVSAGRDEQGTSYISFANSFRFQCNRETAELILRLRKGIDMLLQKKALYPSPIDMNSNDACYIKAIIHLLNKERNSRYENCSDSD